MSVQNVLVTGGCGFIGSNLSKRLCEDGNKVTIIDNLSRGKKRYLDYLDVNADVKILDLREWNEDLLKVFSDIDLVFHCASRIGGNQYLHGSYTNELIALQDNIAIDRNVIRACLESNVKRIVYTSSISVYNTSSQNSPNAIFSENDLERQPLEPEGGYGWAKYIGEKQLNWLSKNGTNIGISRIFKSYGQCDDYSEASGQVVCSLMRKAINYPKERYVVWGDGSVTRCLVYIDDLVDGLIKLSEYIKNDSLTVNMGGQFPIPIIQLSKYIIKIAGKNIKQEHDMKAPVGVKSRIPVLKKAKEKLGWEPTTNLEIGLKKTYEWMKYDIANY